MMESASCRDKVVKSTEAANTDASSPVTSFTALEMVLVLTAPAASSLSMVALILTTFFESQKHQWQQ